MKSRFLTAAELEKLRLACNFDHWLPFEVALVTGMRIGDVLRLKTQNIGCGLITFTAQKTGKSGSVACPRELCDKLRARAGNRLGSWIFPSPANPSAPLTRQAAWARVKRAAKRCGVDPDGVSPHSLRKTFAVQLYQREGLTAVQTALQHARVSTTEIYALSDWLSGENSSKPLTRADIPYVIERVYDALKCRIDNDTKM